MTVNTRRSIKLRRQIKDSSILEPVPRRDRISELPDDLCLLILSFLRIKDAACTSVLSKRWRHTWTYLFNLDFDPKKSLGWEPGHNESTINKYVTLVNQVVMANRAPTIEKFRVYHYVDGTYALDIDGWINFCLKKGVQELELNCSGGYGGFHHEYYTFGSAWQAYLPQDACMVPNFINLRSFSVEALRISGALIEVVLSNCLLLERLCVTWCADVGSLKVVGSSLKLKYLNIVNSDVENVEISAPNLVTIVYWGDCGDLVYKSVPSLVEVDFGGSRARGMVDRTSTQSLQLEKLSVDVYKMDFFFPTTFPTFAKLKQLTISYCIENCVSLLMWTYLIDACPSLQELKLELTWCSKAKRATSTQDLGSNCSDCIQLSLNAFYVVGFVGCAIDIELVSFLVNKAPSLKKVFLDCRNPVHIQGGWEFDDPDIWEARRRAKQLAKRFPAAVDVVIL